jgi:DNA-binding NtrC family response regulator
MKPLVLVVDDEDDMRVTYERLLRRLGYRVALAKTRREGVMLLASERLALVVADVRLSDGSGLDVVAEARRAAEPVPAIVVTGYPSTDSRRLAREAGAAAFLVKPFTASAFTDLVRRTVGGLGW